jgi:hypothetical protein
MVLMCVQSSCVKNLIPNPTLMRGRIFKGRLGHEANGLILIVWGMG